MAREFQSANTEYATYSTTPDVSGDAIVNVSIGVFFYINTTQEQCIMGLMDANGTHGFRISQAGAGASNVLRGRCTGDTGLISATASAPSTGAWHSAVVTASGGGGNVSQVILYLDGTAQTAANGTSDVNGIDQLRVARDTDSESIPFDGRIFRACVWSGTLSQQDVTDFHAGEDPAGLSQTLEHQCEFTGDDSPEPDVVAAGNWVLTGTIAKVADPTFGSASAVLGGLAGLGGIAGDGGLAGDGGGLAG
jgi:hypothetical protein